MIFDDENKDNKNKQLIFLHKLFLISCFLNLKDLADLFITKMHLNPFYRTLDKYSPFIFCCENSLDNLAKFFLSFKYFDSNNK